MSYFPDLEPVHYNNGPHSADSWHVPLRAIGWLEEGNAFPTGPCSLGVIERLEELRQQFAEAFPEFSFRGLHECSMCEGDDKLLHGSHVNLFIPGEGVIYLATGRVDHYIKVHAYAPPQVFIQAIIDCPDPRTGRYAAALLRLNSGERPPLFPEQWKIFKVDQKRVRSRVYEMESEVAARNFAEMLAKRDPGHEYDVERMPDSWATAD